MGFTVGQQVFATKDIGGLLRERVPKGSLGVVTQSGGMWTGRSTKVLFTFRRPILGDKRVEMTVESDEVA